MQLFKSYQIPKKVQQKLNTHKIKSNKAVIQHTLEYRNDNGTNDKDSRIKNESLEEKSKIINKIPLSRNQENVPKTEKTKQLINSIS